MTDSTTYGPPVADATPPVRRSRRLAALIAFAAIPLLAACGHIHYTHHVVVHHYHHVVVHHR